MSLKRWTLVLPVAAMITSGMTQPMFSAQSSSGEDSREILSIDHYVQHPSSVPVIAGDTVQLYVRERVRAGLALRSTDLEGRVVLFVHGAGTPAEVAFDVPHEGYSWMEYLARSGFDVFSMDVTGYGRSTRPSVMNNPCNASAVQQAQLVPGFLDDICDPGYHNTVGTIESDQDDIAAVVDYIRELRSVARVDLIGWSLGGPRAGGYAFRNPDTVSGIVLLAPAYNRNTPSEPPAAVPADGDAMTLQSGADFTENWDRQVGCDTQYDAAVSEAVWSEMLRSDPVGATWGPGVRRAPRTTNWGWNAEAARNTPIPILVVAGTHDAQVSPDRVRDLYDDWGFEKKVFVDLGCASHNAMWERNRLLLFEASREWLADGTVEGMESGVLSLGYE